MKRSTFFLVAFLVSVRSLNGMEIPQAVSIQATQNSIEDISAFAAIATSGLSAPASVATYAEAAQPFLLTINPQPQLAMRQSVERMRRELQAKNEEIKAELARKEMELALALIDKQKLIDDSLETKLILAKHQAELDIIKDHLADIKQRQNQSALSTWLKALFYPEIKLIRRLLSISKAFGIQ